MARPRLKLNEQVVRGMARAGSTNVEIANFLGCDEGTVRNRFSDILAKERARLRVSLRKMQWRQARRGNVTMLIFLGKVMLGQSDKGDQMRPAVESAARRPEYDLSRLSEDQLATVDAIYEQARI